jgi:hypothetical protein
VLLAAIALAPVGCSPGCSADETRRFLYFEGGEELVAWFDFYVVTFGGGGWTASPSSVAANVIVTTDGNRQHYKNTSPFCQIALDLPSFDSVEGASPILLSTSTQEATATYVPPQYQITGLIAGPGYAPGGDSLLVDWTLMGAGELTLGLPPRLGDPNEHIGSPAGLQTPFYAPDAGHDHLFTLLELDNGAPGYDALQCLLPKEEGTLDGTNRRYTIIDTESLEFLEDEGIDIGSFAFVSFVNVEEIEGPFGERRIRVIAGPMIQLDPLVLGP